MPRGWSSAALDRTQGQCCDGSVEMLFPDSRMGLTNPLGSDEPVTIPPGDSSFRVTAEHLGPESMLVVASRRPLRSLDSAIPPACAGSRDEPSTIPSRRGAPSGLAARGQEFVRRHLRVGAAGLRVWRGVLANRMELERDSGLRGGVASDADEASVEPAPRDSFPSVLSRNGLVGQSEAMRSLGELLTKVAATNTTVLILGESGTGKELIARLLHSQSHRAAQPFVAVNCAAVPASLLESELFGHVRGAFTHAVGDKKGLFEQASGGTLFLDEVADIPLEMQATLLRALQERRIRPVGSSTEREVDIRLVAATNRSLEDQVRAGRFREDLYYRVNVVTVEVAPLRERGDDVLLLARHFMNDAARQLQRGALGLTPEAAAALRAHDWPGNVRELQNCIERAVTLADGDLIGVQDLSPAVRASHETRAPLPPVASRDSLPTLQVLEHRYIRHVLSRVSGNKTRAAELLGIDRRTLHRKLTRLRRAEH
ncbi:MAG: sigma 54-interacting transcriptional regulator [Deltaproteobacteria bacterium]|nr:sigma 54-interacting transcriptional regulator [Deltaproteobacteria bacterium]